jgi:hypothetical protein
MDAHKDNMPNQSEVQSKVVEALNKRGLTKNMKYIKLTEGILGLLQGIYLWWPRTF